MNRSFDLPDVQCIATAVAAWGISAALLTLLAALAAALFSVPAAAIGYISSALSFAAALAAGRCAMRGRKTGALYTGLVAGVVITTIVLNMGFIIAGSGIAADGVLSVATFTLAGCLAGSVFFVGGHGKQKRNRMTQRKT